MDEEKTLEELVQEHQESKWRYVLAVWDRLLPLIKYIANQRERRIMGRYGNDFDDYVQEAFLVLVRCMDLFDCKTARFKSYYFDACRHRFCYIDKWDTRENRRRVVETVSLFETVYDDDDETMLIDVLSSKDDPFADVTNKVFLEEAIDTLPKNKRDVAWAYIVENKSLREIAAERGCSKNNVSYLLQEARKELAKRYGSRK